MVLGFGEMLEDDRPPESIWLDDPALIDHFDAVREKRKSQMTSKPSDDDTFRDDEGGGEMVENALAAELLAGAGL